MRAASIPEHQRAESRIDAAIASHGSDAQRTQPPRAAHRVENILLQRRNVQAQKETDRQPREAGSSWVQETQSATLDAWALIHSLARVSL